MSIGYGLVDRGITFPQKCQVSSPGKDREILVVVSYSWGCYYTEDGRRWTVANPVA